MGNGWAEWDHPRPPRAELRPTGLQQVRYCARCNTRTLWAPAPDSPTLLACGCGMSAATLLDLDELDNVRNHYRLSTGDLDDMVGLPAPMRT